LRGEVEREEKMLEEVPQGGNEAMLFIKTIGIGAETTFDNAVAV
jgi:hypothetical protein